jgi:hypothetical protein
MQGCISSRVHVVHVAHVIHVINLSQTSIQGSSSRVTTSNSERARPQERAIGL